MRPLGEGVFPRPSSPARRPTSDSLWALVGRGTPPRPPDERPALPTVRKHVRIPNVRTVVAAMPQWDDALFMVALRATERPPAVTDSVPHDVPDGAVAPSSPGAGGSQLQSSAPAAAGLSLQSTPPKCKKRKAGCRATGEGSEKKERLAPTPCATWACLRAEEKWGEVGSVFIEADASVVNGERKKSDHPPMAIPLWPQYSLTFRNVPVRDTTWIHLTTTEPWLKLMADYMTNSCVRDVVSKVMGTLRRALSCTFAQSFRGVQGASFSSRLRSWHDPNAPGRLGKARASPPEGFRNSEGADPEARYSTTCCRRPASRRKMPRTSSRVRAMPTTPETVPRESDARGSNGEPLAWRYH